MIYDSDDIWVSSLGGETFKISIETSSSTTFDPNDRLSQLPQLNNSSYAYGLREPPLPFTPYRNPAPFGIAPFRMWGDYEAPEPNQRWDY